MRKRSFIPYAAGLTFLVGACSQSNDAGPAATDTAVAPASENLGPPPPPEGEPMDAPAQEGAAAASPAVIEGITNKRVSFEKGSSAARISGSLTGYETIDYLLNVKAGQSLNVSMATRNTATYFNILEPGETEVAIYNGSTGGNMYEGVTAKSGDYRIRIYMMRSAARREEKADFGLEVAVN